MHVVGTAFLIVGIRLWVSAAIKEKLREKIIANQLVTTGVYALVRNPIYSAFAFVMSGGGATLQQFVSASAASYVLGAFNCDDADRGGEVAA